MSKSELDTLRRLKSVIGAGVAEPPGLLPTAALLETPVPNSADRFIVDVLTKWAEGGREIGTKMGSILQKPQESQLKRWFYRVLEALAFIHRNKLYHGGIKPKNLIISQNEEEAFLVDAITGSLDPSALPLMDTQGISALGLYRPPDWINAPQPDKVDIWATGMIFFQIVSNTNIERVRAVRRLSRFPDI